MQQLEMDFGNKSETVRNIEREIERNAFRNFCYFMYIENCVERHNESREIYENKFRYIRKNYDYLKREFKESKSLWCKI